MKAALLALGFALALAFDASAPAAADAPPLAFPRDHGSHPADALEWWYWTGHLSGDGGAAYGFQLTFFRLRDVHLAHFAWSDLTAGTFKYEEKVHLALPGIAEASSERLDVANEDWSAKETGGAQKLSVRTSVGTLALTLTPAKPPAIHGERGISRKGPGLDDYSHYVSITRLTAAGSLERRGGKKETLSGTAWFDHEWGPGGLPAGVGGWDWFALQLSDGSELMLYRMRLARSGGAASPFSAGTFVPADGTRPVPISWKDVRLAPKSTWTSKRTKAVYPAVWSLEVASLALAVEITPLLADQELVTEASTRVTYWEGACRVEGRRGGRAIGGRAYVEMTGYAGPDVPGLSP
jgi:predicted secreted hydrolase